MKVVKKRLSKAEQLLLILNVLLGIALLLYIFAGDIFAQQFFTVKIKGINIPILLLLNIFFIGYWLIRARFHFLISLAVTLLFVFMLINDFGLPKVQKGTLAFVMVPNNGQVDDFQHNYIGNNVSLPDHPRLLLSTDQEKVLKGNISMDANWNKINRIILDGSDVILTKEIETKLLNGDQIIRDPASVLRRLFFLSYSWRITKQKKYLEAATNDLLTVASVKTWNASGNTLAAEISTGVAIAYDWLYNDLSDVDRLLIQKAIVSKGLEPSLDAFYSSWLSDASDVNIISNTAMLYSALAIQEFNPKLTNQIINRSIGSLTNSMAMYKPSGATPFGYEFGLNAINFNVMAIDALDKAFKDDFGLAKTEGFTATGVYMQNLTGPAGMPFNYSDGDGKTTLQPNPAAFWLADKLNDGSLLWTAHDILIHGTNKDFVNNKLLPASVIFGNKFAAKDVKAPANNMLVANGANAVALMRTSWTDPNAIFVGFKAGMPSNAYGHMDIGSFVLNAAGKRWVMDLGGEFLGNLEVKGINVLDLSQESRRWNSFRMSNKSHSTLTVNNDKQQVKAVADIVRSSDAANFMYAITDMSATYSGSLTKAERGIAIVDKKVVQLRDEIETPNAETTVRWKILTGAKVKITSANTAELTQDDKKYYVKVVEPANVQLQTWTAEPASSYERRNPGISLLGFNINKTKAEKIAISVVFSDDNNKILPINKLAALKDWK